jgi:hypothetical protein
MGNTAAEKVLIILTIFDVKLLNTVKDLGQNLKSRTF